LHNVAVCEGSTRPIEVEWLDQLIEAQKSDQSLFSRNSKWFVAGVVSKANGTGTSALDEATVGQVHTWKTRLRPYSTGMQCEFHIQLRTIKDGKFSQLTQKIPDVHTREKYLLGELATPSIRVRPKLLVAVQNACLACLFDGRPVGHLPDANICRIRANKNKTRYRYGMEGELLKKSVKLSMISPLTK
jgi:hypothetical protein